MTLIVRARAGVICRWELVDCARSGPRHFCRWPWEFSAPHHPLHPQRCGWWLLLREPILRRVKLETLELKPVPGHGHDVQRVQHALDDEEQQREGHLQAKIEVEPARFIQHICCPDGHGSGHGSPHTCGTAAAVWETASCIQELARTNQSIHYEQQVVPGQPVLVQAPVPAPQAHAHKRSSLRGRDWRRLTSWLGSRSAHAPIQVQVAQTSCSALACLRAPQAIDWTAHSFHWLPANGRRHRLVCRPRRSPCTAAGTDNGDDEQH